MFCSECGTKLEEDAVFCGECGHKVELETEVKEETVEIKEEPKQEEKNKKENEPREKKKSKKGIVAIVLLILIAALLGVGYKIGSDLTNPKHIANEYIKAVINNDTNKLYNYLDLSGDKTFVSKKIFKELMPEEDYTDIENYKITEVTKKDLTAVVKFSYIVKNEKGEKEEKINLKKVGGKEYLIFDKWKVDQDFSDFTLKDYTIKAIKGSEITYAGVKVTDKYLDSNKSNEQYDVYVLPQVFRYETKVKAKFPNGIEVEDEVTPSTYYNQYTFKLSKDSITDEMKKEILDDSKKVLTTIYENAMVSRPYEEVEAKYKHSGIDLSKLESNYKELVATLERAVNQLIDIKFTDLSLYDLNIDENGNFVVKVKANFEYTVEYIMYGGNTEQTTKTNSSVMTLTFKYDDNKFYLVNATDLKSYFGRY